MQCARYRRTVQAPGSMSRFNNATHRPVPGALDLIKRPAAARLPTCGHARRCSAAAPPAARPATSLPLTNETLALTGSYGPFPESGLTVLAGPKQGTTRH